MMGNRELVWLRFKIYIFVYTLVIFEIWSEKLSIIQLSLHFMVA